MSLDMAIIGLGYVDLPLAQQACRTGLNVSGLDVNEKMVKNINRACCNLIGLVFGV